MPFHYTVKLLGPLAGFPVGLTVQRPEIFSRRVVVSAPNNKDDGNRDGFTLSSFANNIGFFEIFQTIYDIGC
jgi:hypothetical protein